MTISLKHAFTSAIADGADASKVRASNWNAEHALTMATARVLGRLTAGGGVAEELTAAQIAEFVRAVRASLLVCQSVGRSLPVSDPTAVPTLSAESSTLLTATANLGSPFGGSCRWRGRGGVCNKHHKLGYRRLCICTGPYPTTLHSRLHLQASLSTPLPPLRRVRFRSPMMGNRIYNNTASSINFRTMILRVN
jgi:hypothetical protein